MNLLREKLRARGHHLAMGGGDSSSASTQTTTYNVSDSRQVHSTDSRSYSDSRVDSRSYRDSGNTNITTLDGGAITAARDVSLRALDSNATNTAVLFAAADRLFGRGAEILSANMQLTADLSQTAANAYEGATAQATGNKTMLLGGLAVVGVVAVMAMGK